MSHQHGYNSSLSYKGAIPNHDLFSRIPLLTMFIGPIPKHIHSSAYATLKKEALKDDTKGNPTPCLVISFPTPPPITIKLTSGPESSSTGATSPTSSSPASLSTSPRDSLLHTSPFLSLISRDGLPLRFTRSGSVLRVSEPPLVREGKASSRRGSLLGITSPIASSPLPLKDAISMSPLKSDISSSGKVTEEADDHDALEPLPELHAVSDDSVASVDLKERDEDITRGDGVVKEIHSPEIPRPTSSLSTVATSHLSGEEEEEEEEIEPIKVTDVIDDSPEITSKTSLPKVKKSVLPFLFPSISSFSTENLADAVCSYTSEPYYKVTPREVVSQSFTNPKNRFASPNLVCLVDRFNHTTSFLVVSLLGESDPKVRSKVLGRYIKAAKLCVDRGNFQAMYCFISALKIDAVDRLKIDMVPSVRRLYTDLSPLVGTNEGNVRMKKMILGTHGKYNPKKGEYEGTTACVPFPGMFFKVIVYACELDRYVDGYLFNMQRAALCYNATFGFLRYQAQGFRDWIRDSQSKQVRKMIIEHDYLETQQFYDLSYRILPKE
ncbi:Ras-like guanine nucleotide exchange factor like protein [Aduncisulcus paluster]|uniref:Ras-like guanine nucleotide exchange factor like protein n=1 Tax=Aduncisulcus paluster TaxID=2918883 RepID=A0ABQ5KSZ9_9EUKA|nr:Ras-like guanine nucleotide exchange factor like protein [Aduncisulcus paluster]